MDMKSLLSSSSVESKPEADDGIITCPTCGNHAAQQVGRRKKTICPFCGNFYDMEAATTARLGANARAAATDSGSSLPAIETRKTKGQSLTEGDGAVGGESDSSSSLPPIESRGQPSSASSAGRASPTDASVPASVRPRLPASSLKIDKETVADIEADKLDANIGMMPLPPALVAAAAARQAASKSPATTPTTMITTPEELKAAHDEAKRSDAFKNLANFYDWAFGSMTGINHAFRLNGGKIKSTVEVHGLNMDFIHTAFDVLVNLPQELQKTVLRGIVGTLLKDKKLEQAYQPLDDLRCFFVLLQNPQFDASTTYVIFAHLVRQVSALSDHEHHYLVHWIKKLPKKIFSGVVKRLHNFVTCRLFPSAAGSADLPPETKTSWWIPSAVKVLALLNAANNLTVPPIVDYREFYNQTIDHTELMADYYTWQSPEFSSNPSLAPFTFCQYPFLLSIAAKRNIMQRDSEQQMILMARKSLIQNVQQRQAPDINMLFLNLNVRRSHMVSDSLNEIARKQQDLKKKLKVTFHGEAGLDMGGLTKEWFLLLCKKIFDADYGMFNYNKESGNYWFNTVEFENYQEYNLVGVLMGLAVYNSTILDIRFPKCCYKKLLSPAVVPYGNPTATVGVCSLGLDDLEGVMPEVSRGLKELLDYDGDVEDDFCLTFQVSVQEFGQVRTVNLKSDGGDIPVTKENRQEYVKLYVDWLLNRSIYPHFRAFYHGFHGVCASNALIMLRPEEVEVLVCGNPNLDMSELKRLTHYEGYSPADTTVRHFWDIVLAMKPNLQKRLLRFTTGSDRIPIGGMSEIQFKITRVDAANESLPMSHTCFNQLMLPAYKSRKTLKKKLYLSLENSEGFGLE